MKDGVNETYIIIFLLHRFGHKSEEKREGKMGVGGGRKLYNSSMFVPTPRAINF